MFDQKLKKQLNNSIDSLTIKYDMFYTNHEYKKSHFKSDDEYVLVQRNLSTEIQLEESNIKKILQNYFLNTFQGIQLIAYDSRFICINKLHHCIGKLLIKGIPDDVQINKIKETFFNEFSFDTKIERFENLPDDLQKKFTF